MGCCSHVRRKFRRAVVPVVLDCCDELGPDDGLELVDGDVEVLGHRDDLGHGGCGRGCSFGCLGCRMGCILGQGLGVERGWGQLGHDAELEHDGELGYGGLVGGLELVGTNELEH